MCATQRTTTNCRHKGHARKPHWV